MDFVWFTGDFYPECLEHVTRLPNEELQARRLAFGLREWENVPIPAQDGSATLNGFCICRDFFGSAFFQPGARKQNRAIIADLMMLEQIEPGLVVGNIRPEVLKDPKFLANARAHKKREQSRLTHEIAEDKRREEARAQRRAGAMRRFLVTTAHLMGVQTPAKISSGELRDIYQAAALIGKEVPDPDQWLQATCAEPPAPEPPTDFHTYTAGARAAVVQRKEVVKNGKP